MTGCRLDQRKGRAWFTERLPCFRRQLTWPAKVVDVQQLWWLHIADMHWIKSETYSAVAAAARVDQACIPTYKSCRGHPVGSGSPLLGGLKCLWEDFGARQPILGHPAKVSELPVDNPGVRRDVDRPEDLA